MMLLSMSCIIEVDAHFLASELYNSKFKLYLFLEKVIRRVRDHEMGLVDVLVVCHNQISVCAQP